MLPPAEPWVKINVTNCRNKKVSHHKKVDGIDNEKWNKAEAIGLAHIALVVEIKQNSEQSKIQIETPAFARVNGPSAQNRNKYDAPVGH